MNRDLLPFRNLECAWSSSLLASGLLSSGWRARLLARSPDCLLTRDVTRRANWNQLHYQLCYQAQLLTESSSDLILWPLRQGLHYGGELISCHPTAGMRDLKRREHQPAGSFDASSPTSPSQSSIWARVSSKFIEHPDGMLARPASDHYGRLIHYYWDSLTRLWGHEFELRSWAEPDGKEDATTRNRWLAFIVNR